MNKVKSPVSDVKIGYGIFMYKEHVQKSHRIIVILREIRSRVEKSTLIKKVITFLILK